MQVLIGPEIHKPVLQKWLRKTDLQMVFERNLCDERVHKAQTGLISRNNSPKRRFWGAECRLLCPADISPRWGENRFLPPLGEGQEGGEGRSPVRNQSKLTTTLKGALMLLAMEVPSMRPTRDVEQLDG